MQTRIIVIGGGASGFMAGITAAREGAAVTILEHGREPMKKLLLTGNGKCNLTNTQDDPMAYRGQDPDFAISALFDFSVKDTFQFFGELGIYTKNRNGYIYPVTDQAAAVKDVLLMEAQRLKIKVKCMEHVEAIRKDDGLFSITTQSYIYEADKVILAAGSSASALLEADGSGYSLAEKCGHTIIPVLPALVQLKCGERFYPKLAGMRAQGRILVKVDGIEHACETGELQFADYGISGIPVFQLSRFAVSALSEEKEVVLEIDFLPDFDEQVVWTFWENRKNNNGYKPVRKMLTGLFHEKLIPVLLERAAVDVTKTTDTLTREEEQCLMKQIKHFETRVTGHKSFEQAQVCSGGIDTAQVREDTLESKIMPGLYFCGEILDIDGTCGGYNLQWAWSSGYAAGKHAACGCEEKKI